MSQQIISRKEAKSRGLTHYFTGKPCKRGHTSKQLVASGNCVDCFAEYPWVSYTAAWRQRNPDKAAAGAGKYNANKRYPGCIPDGFKVSSTVPFYAEARRLTEETGTRHQVDHIVPLSAGGLHEASNLQVLTAAENIAKGATLSEGALCES